MNFFNCHVNEQAIEKATNALRSRYLSQGVLVEDFEHALAKKLGLRNPIALNSGTSALHLALELIRVRGKEVILPAQTFVATGMAVLMAGATPVFADVDPATGCICPLSVTCKATSKTAAIIAVDWGGHVSDLAMLKDLGLPVVEDAAHSLGATYKSQPVGSVADYTCFSFQSTKLLTTGDGGALCCLDENKTMEAELRRWFGIGRNLPFHPTGEREFDVAEVGYKYHMNDVAAAIGLGNLEDFPQRWFRRQEIARMYRDGLQGVAGLEHLRVETDRSHAYYFFSVKVENREKLIRKLNVGYGYNQCCSVVCRRIDRLSVFGGQRQDLPGQDEFDKKHLALPVHEALTDGEVLGLIKTIKEGW